MKKIIYSLCGAVLLAFTACQSDDIAPATGAGEVTVSFSAQLPASMASRAISDGTTCEDLNVSVYDQDGNFIFDCGNQYVGAFAGDNLATDVELKLVVGKTYKVVFFAYAPGCPYEFDAATANLDMNYDTEGNLAQDEKRDMFFHMETVEVLGNARKDIKLVRPFAQVNIGTTLADYQAAVRAGTNVTATGTTFTADVYNTLNLLSGEATDRVDVRMEAAPVITTALTGAEADMTEPLVLNTGEKFVHLSMNYLLMDNKGREAVTTVTMHTNDTEDKVFANIPVERNYRTNIVGELFAATMNYHVIITPEYTDEINRWDVWDGETVTAPAQDPENPTSFTISTAAEFVGMLQATTMVPANQKKNIEITLEADIDLAGHAAPALGSFDMPFEGTLDGNGHTITGITVAWGPENGAAGDPGFNYGFIHTAASGSVFKNITIENATVAYDPEDLDFRYGNFMGVLVGQCYGDITFENVTIKNCTAVGFGKVGGIMGCAADRAGTTTFRNCKVINTTIKGRYNLGGLCGLVQNNCVVENCDVDVNFETEPSETYETLDTTGRTDRDGQEMAVNGLYWKSGNVYYAGTSTYYNYFVTYNCPLNFRDNDVLLPLMPGCVADGLCRNDLSTPHLVYTK